MAPRMSSTTPQWRSKRFSNSKSTEPATGTVRKGSGPMPDANANEGRLRPHPNDRFAPQQLAIDLNATAARLRQEAHTGERGHRQQTLYHEQGLTIALFLFERFTHLPTHRAKGLVNIHVLRGKLKVTTE